jgi:hypothetical protein
MDISSITLKQVLSASVASTGIQGNMSVGGSNVISLTASDVDIAYGFTMTSGNVANQVIWDLEDSTLELGAAGAAGTGLVCTEEVGDNGSPAAIIDPTGEAVPSSATIVALYYEAPSTNAGDVVVVASAQNMGIINLGGGLISRSALFVPRRTSTGASVTFDWDTVSDTVNVYCLAKE